MLLENEQDSFLEDNFENDIWTTKEFDTIPLKEMTTNHIENSIKLIERTEGESIFGYCKMWLPKLKQELEKRNNVK